MCKMQYSTCYPTCWVPYLRQQFSVKFLCFHCCYLSTYTAYSRFILLTGFSPLKFTQSFCSFLVFFPLQHYRVAIGCCQGSRLVVRCLEGARRPNQARGEWSGQPRGIFLRWGEWADSPCIASVTMIINFNRTQTQYCHLIIYKCTMTEMLALTYIHTNNGVIGARIDPTLPIDEQRACIEFRVYVGNSSDVYM